GGAHRCDLSRQRARSGASPYPPPVGAAHQGPSEEGFQDLPPGMGIGPGVRHPRLSRRLAGRTSSRAGFRRRGEGRRSPCRDRRRSDQAIGRTGGGLGLPQAGRHPIVSEEETCCGFCAIIGPTNAGKSTLLNQLAGSKLAIVSHKVQTTRSRVRAIIIEDRSQIIFVDTPGIFTPRRKLDEAMVADAWAGAVEADARMLIIDSRKGLDLDARVIMVVLARMR